ncbi:hypothetical protein [Hymenobacter sp. CRA2]|uniref:hypothetical protein n=1 Tax=Hymenobacter sp. CRA2 TaxID=1955620 RepID=UPI001116BBF8|nr:hypothetical protein [Hymenobacter sp. CRA2]
MIKASDITSSQLAIANLFYQQVENGKQSKELNTPVDRDLRACGQLLQEFERSQRGIHGTTAALYVLAQSNDSTHNAELPKLISYLDKRRSIEKGPSNQNDLLRDYNNTIKTGETLFALSRVKLGQASKEAFEKKLLTQLVSSKADLNGWDYFDNSYYGANQQSATTYLLPTIFAVKGLLSIKSYDLDAINFIQKECSKIVSSGVVDHYTFSIVVLGLHTLSFYDYNNTHEVVVKKLLSDLLSSSLATFESHIEINLEYWFAGKHEYVRIPWQLYLIALTAKLNPEFFSKNVVQKRLSEIIIESQTIGFKYPQSGIYVSSRTSSIVYECLNNVSSSLGKSYVYDFYSAKDSVQGFFTNKWIKRLLVATVLLVLCYGLYAYLTTTLDALGPKATFTDKVHSFLSALGPEVLITVCLFLLNWGRSKQ